jgi:hypothetical protein
LYKLEEEARSAKARRLRLTRKERTDLRFLRVLYSRHIEPYDPDKDPSYHPLRDAPVAEDGNLYRRDSKLRPPKDGEIEEEFVDIPRYCYPPHARLPPHDEADILYVDAAGFRWSNKLLA